MNRVRRKIVAWFGVGALLFMQFAVAAYACSAPNSGSSQASSAAALSQHPCESSDQELPNLCEQHCLQSSQTVDTQPHSTVTQPALPLLAVLSGVGSHIKAKRDPHRLWLATGVDPPPLVRFCVLRI